MSWRSKVHDLMPRMAAELDHQARGSTPALAGAFYRGAIARVRGGALSENPYGAIGWRSLFAVEWSRGFRAAADMLERRP